MNTHTSESKNSFPKRKVIIASAISLTAVLMVWGGLQLQNAPKKDHEFVIDRSVTSEDDAQTVNQSNSPGHSEVVAVADDIQNGLKQEDAAFQNPKVQALAEVIEMGLTDDPGTMEDFENLSAEDKAALKVFYRQLENEDRNGRGATVYLLGKDLASEDDVTFLSEVIKERPCLSLDDCQSNMDDEIKAEDDEVVQIRDKESLLGYPQIMAIRSLESALNSARDSGLRQKILTVVKEAATNSNPQVQQAAQAILKRF